jgi:sirohydrochlorin cobaltochelatase
VKPALLIAGHGTRDPEGVAGFTALTKRLTAQTEADGEPLDVAGGFIELSVPPLRDAVSGLVEQGHRTLVAVPLMLSAAGHSKGDVPAALAREKARHPGLIVRYGRPLGPHPVLLNLLAERISAAAQELPEPYAVLLVGRGSTDPDANAEVCKDTRMLWEGRGYELTETAFVSLARPSVAEGLERCRRLGARRIVVARYFLFAGVLPDRVAAQAAAYARAHPGLNIQYADVLGDCDEIAGLVAERYREALTGDIRMNCDVCQYRTALPGLAHRVGAPQQPHDHPHDHAPHDHPHDHAPHDHPHDHAPQQPHDRAHHADAS